MTLSTVAVANDLVSKADCLYPAVVAAVLTQRTSARLLLKIRLLVLCH